MLPDIAIIQGRNDAEPQQCKAAVMQNRNNAAAQRNRT
jgi:hypothetical protein